MDLRDGQESKKKKNQDRLEDAVVERKHYKY